MITENKLFQTEREKLFDRFSDKLEIASNFSRKIVSFQANKEEPIYRWFKYKEGFSSALVKYFLSEFSEKPGKLLDPFAGAGTTLFAGQEMGWEAYGIELLPVGTFVMKTREALNNIDFESLRKKVKGIFKEINDLKEFDTYINHISITKDAYPNESEEYLNKYLTYCSKIADDNIKELLKFAGFSVLEEISYTRKDGQYLRWDYRSNRELGGKPFNKGIILSFEEAVKAKLTQIVNDISPNKSKSLYEQYELSEKLKPPVSIIDGSCLDILPKLESEYFDFTITSPPYCNRYDYTRTYALELIYLGFNNEDVRNLRQTMLSCTVENKEKYDYLCNYYESIGQSDAFRKIISVYGQSNAMSEVNDMLEVLNRTGKLNNNNVARMVKNYFLELCFVIYELARVTKRNGYCVMVNDNVRYGGEEIPVDLILSEFAENFGFSINKIYVLPTGKGNSSQQMGNYGRTEIRKCVYLWQKE